MKRDLELVNGINEIIYGTNTLHRLLAQDDNIVSNNIVPITILAIVQYLACFLFSFAVFWNGFI